jgi:hypothetical protein
VVLRRAAGFGALLAAPFLAASLDGVPPSGPDLAKAAERITAGSAFHTVEVLAAPGMQGRLSGTEGYRRASEWILSEVRKAGLRPTDAFPDYRQPFTHGLAGVESASLTLLPSEAAKESGPAEAKLLEDFAPMVNGGSGDVTGEVVFVGFGFHAPAEGRDDYAGVDAKGKVVLALRGEPEKGEWKDHRSSAARTKTAASLGAAAFLLVDAAVTSTNVSISRDLPEAFLSEAFADRLLASQKMTVAELRKVLAKGGTVSFATGRSVRLSVKGLPWREVTTHNVVAVLPGSDPALRGEYVLVGAHLDHIGAWPRLNPGADDNASGSATLLEVARAAASLKERPRRSLVFVWFAGEELGLLGAEHFASHPPAGLGTCTAVLNLDMLGTGTGLYAAGGENFPRIRTALEGARDRLAPGFGLKAGRIRGEGRADHAPFFEKGIPAVSLFGSGAEHHGYHSPDDTVYFIAPKAMESGGRIVLGAAWALADEKPGSRAE